MTTDAHIEDYLAKAAESLTGAESELANGRFNNAANRTYYTALQAAIAALLRASIRPADPRTGWGHAFVQSQFAGQLVSRRKVYPAALRDVLPLLLTLRHTADYETDQVSHTQAQRALRRARDFVVTIQRGGDRP